MAGDVGSLAFLGWALESATQARKPMLRLAAEVTASFFSRLMAREACAVSSLSKSRFWAAIQEHA